MIKQSILLFFVLISLASYSIENQSEEHLSEMTLEERNALYRELVSPGYVAGSDYYYSIIFELYQAGLSHEAILEALNRGNYAVFYFLLQNGYEPPLTYVSEDGTIEKLINHPALDYFDYSTLIIYKLMNIGHEPDLRTIKNQRNEILPKFYILFSSEDKDWINDPELLQWLRHYSDGEITSFPIPLVRQYEKDINNLITQIINGNKHAMVEPLSRVLDFLEIVKNDRDLSISNQYAFSSNIYFSGELKSLVSLAVYLDRVEFVELLLQSQPELFTEGFFYVVSNHGGMNVIDYLVGSFIGNEMVSQKSDDLYIFNPAILQSLVEHGLIDTVEGVDFEFSLYALYSFNIEPVDFLRFYIPLIKKTIPRSGVNEKELFFDIALAIINSETRRLRRFINQGYDLFNSGVIGVSFFDLILAFGNDAMIDLAIASINKSDGFSISENQSFALAMNPNNISLDGYWDELNLSDRISDLMVVAFWNADLELLNLLLAKGFDLNDVSEAPFPVSILLKAENDDFISFLINNRDDLGANLMLYPPVFDGLMYRYTPFSISNRSLKAFYAAESLPGWIFAFGSDDLVAEMYGLLADEVDEEMLVNLLFLAIKFDNLFLVELIIAEDVMKEESNPDLKDVLYFLFEAGSQEALEIVLAGSFLGKMENSEVIRYFEENEDFDFSPLSLRYLHSQYDIFKYHIELLEYERLLRMGHTDHRLKSFYHLKNKYNAPLFELAVKSKNEDFARYIFDNHLQLVRTDVTFAISIFGEWIIPLSWSWLMDYLFDQNPEFFGFRNRDGETLLHNAVEQRDSEAITYLLEKGFDPNIPDNRGQTAYELFLLRKPFIQDADQIASLFQSKAAKPLSPLDFQAELLANSIKSGNIHEIKEQLQNGVDPNGIIISSYRRQEFSESYINYAARYGYDVVCAYLLLHGADVNCTTQPIGLSPLAAAIIERNYETARILIHFGADLDFIIPSEAMDAFQVFNSNTSLNTYISQRGLESSLFFENQEIRHYTEELEQAMKSDTPKALVQLLEKDHSVLSRFSFDVHENSNYMKRVFREKPLEFIEELFNRAHELPNPGTLVYIAALVDREGLVELLINHKATKERDYEQRVPYYRHNIYEYNIVKIIEQFSGNNSIAEKERFDFVKEYKPLPSEMRKALKYAISKHSQQGNELELMWNYSRALQYRTPEIFLLLMNYDVTACKEIKELFFSIYNGDINRVKELIDSSEFDSDTQWHECSLLNWAAFNNRGEIAQWLLSEGASFKSRYYRHRLDFVEPSWEVWKVPVTWAVLHQNKELVSALIDAGEDFENLYLDDNIHGYYSVFDMAMNNQRTEILHYLIESGTIAVDYGSNNYNLLNKAIFFDDVELSLILLNQLSKAEWREEQLNYRGPYFASGFERAIQYAVSCEAMDVLNAFRNLDGFDDYYYNWRLLNTAILKKNLSVTIDLLNSGVKPASDFLQNQSLAFALFSFATNEVYDLLQMAGWSRFDLLASTNRPQNIVRAVVLGNNPENFIEVFLNPEFEHSINMNSVLKKTIEFDHEVMFRQLLAAGVSWFEGTNAANSLLRHVNDYGTWQRLFDIVIEFENQTIHNL
ncbi:ankyrin repeat domain-containing protein [Natronoflexus pectinivorans]|uniref:Ankyrin repeat protein n=1 Tax=Natronoflexus pectinivorans TaxID=682526 RepID=A0A4R2GFF6_9BACT|nr:ankyrin repeat domain-containing protein [Natronoflexus pectinivorans]TCO06029.1 ankyrin repeat protein [Natronoflexus pectinivorans]